MVLVSMKSTGSGNELKKCDFCGKDQESVLCIMLGNNGKPSICSECVGYCLKAMSDHLLKIGNKKENKP